MTSLMRIATMRRRPSGAALLLLGAGLLGAARADAQGAAAVTDGSDAAIGAEATQTVVTLVGKALKERGARDPSAARYTRLRPGRAGALCGEVDATNRMGAHTGPRGFVADPTAGFGGILPDAPELRHPSSPAQYQAMQRTLELFRANCAE